MGQGNGWGVKINQVLGYGAFSQIFASKGFLFFTQIMSLKW